MKIWYQSAVEMKGSSAYSDALQAHFKRIASPGVEVSLFGAKTGTWGDLQPAKVSGFPYVFHKVVKNIFIEAALQAEEEGYDAVIIGSSTDPGLREARSMVDIPVVSAMESSFLVASTVADKIGLIAPTHETAHIVNANLEQYRLAGKIAAWETLEPKLADKELNGLFTDPSAFLARFADTARRAIAKGADAVIAAEGILAEVVATNGVSEIDGATIVDPIGTAVAFAEMQVKLHKLTGLRPGRCWHFAKPSPDIIEAVRKNTR
ncbi:allantoin racemase [Paraburkholderia sacchari]|uniref:aspartate/glutamate racemase family protein n=1 Tax=Paraburkholderia sacchari TaxID=159450 RepID=UPI0039A4CB6A